MTASTALEHREPGGATGPERTATPGHVVAAILASAFAVLALALAQVVSEVSRGFSDFMFALGKAWIPNAQGIGPYSGKETMLLLAWGGSWVLLHVALRKRSVDLKTWFAVFLAILATSTLLLWPPVWHILAPG